MSNVKLQPVAMGPYAPDFGVYAPSQFRSVKEISKIEFLERYANSAMALSVSVDGVSPPERITCYAHGMDGWYMIIDG